MADLLSTLEALYGGSSDLGGAPRSDDARALAQLILGGGSASVGGNQLFGQPSRTAVEEAATRARMGGFGREPDQELSAAVLSGQVDPAAILDRPTSPPTERRLVAAGPNVEEVQDVPVPEAPISRSAPGTFGQPQAPRPTSPEFQRVVDNANAIAASLSPARTPGAASETKTLLANPYGPGSFDPDDPKQVAEVQAQKARADKLESTRQLLGGPLLALLPDDVRKQVTKRALEEAGLLPSKAQETKEVAKAKAEGERAGGKGQSLPEGLAAAAGTPAFLDMMATQGVNLPPQQQIALERLHDARVKQKTPEEKNVTAFENAQSSVKRLDRVADLYEAAVAEGGGSLSQNLKLALGKNTTFSSFLQNKTIPFADNLTDAEASYVAEANSLLIGMRQLYDDNRMSDQDVKNALTALGNPAVGPELYRKQLNATKKVVEERGSAILRSLQARGKDVSGLSPVGRSGAVPGVPAGNVMVVSPDGKRGFIPESQLQEAIAAGYRQ